MQKHKRKSETESELSPDSLTTTETEPINQGGSPSINESATQSITPSVNEPSNEEKSDFAKPVSSRSRLLVPAVFETIPEEDETALDDSLLAGREHMEGGGEEEKEEGERSEEGERGQERESEKGNGAVRKEAAKEGGENEVQEQGERMEEVQLR